MVPKSNNAPDATPSNRFNAALYTRPPVTMMVLGAWVYRVISDAAWLSTAVGSGSISVQVSVAGS